MILRVKKLGLVLVLVFLIAGVIMPFITAQASSVKLYPIEDAHVESEHGDSNYAHATEAKVGYYSSGARRYYYLKFRISDVGIQADQIINATLYVYVISHPEGGSYSDFYLKNVTNSWSESSITWNNKPSPGDTVAGGFGFPDSGWKSIDVTSWIQNCQGECSLVFVYDASNLCEYRIASREYDDVDKRPYLLIYYQPETSTVTQTITETVTETQTITETQTETQTQTVTETTTVANTTITETQTVSETITTTQTINNTVYSTVTTTVANTTYYTTIYETISPAYDYGNQTANYYTDLANQLVPLVMVIGVICSLLGLLLSATGGRR